MHKLFFCTFFSLISFLNPLWAFTLDDLLPSAQAGDYAIYAEGDLKTTLKVLSTSASELVLEEKTTTSENLVYSHIHFWLDLKTKKFTKAYSPLKSAWLDIGAQNEFLTTLFALSLEKTPDSKRKRIGGSSSPHHPFWNPSLLIQDQIARPECSLWHATWPKDGSPLSDKKISLYLLPPLPNIPVYFPAWIELHDDLGNWKMRALEIGRKPASKS